MKAHNCCKTIKSGSDVEPLSSNGSIDAPRSLARRSLEIVKWIIPSAALALLPKCPACLAAYIALGTGIGLSYSTASYLRLLLIIVCLASLTYSMARLLRRVHMFSHATRTLPRT